MRHLFNLLYYKDLRSALLHGDWDYLYYCYFAQPNIGNQETLIAVEGPHAKEVTHVGLCAPSCQCSDATTLKAIQSIS